MENRRTSLAEQESWAGTAAGALCFALTGLQMMAFEIPHGWALNQWLQENAVLMLLFWLGIGPVGYALGWMRGFPRWSYPYTGMAIIMALYMTMVATPGIRILGYTFGPRDMWGWRAFVPLALATLIAVLFSRPRNQLPRLFGNIRQDPSILSFLLFGFMPLLVMIEFDEIDRLYSLYFMALVAALMVIAAVVYLRSRTGWSRSLSLILAMIVIIAVSEAGSIAFWQENGWVNVEGSIVQGAVVALILSIPALVELVRDLSARRRMQSV